MFARIRPAREEGEGGFPLIELLVVIIIIGILAAIAIPVFLNQRKKGYDAQVKSDLRNMATAEETYLTDGDAYLDGTPATVVSGLLNSGFKQSSTVVIDQVLARTSGTGTTKSGSFCIVGHNSKGG